MSLENSSDRLVISGLWKYIVFMSVGFVVVDLVIWQEDSLSLLFDIMLGTLGCWMWMTNPGFVIHRRGDDFFINDAVSPSFWKGSVVRTRVSGGWTLCADTPQPGGAGLMVEILPHPVSFQDTERIIDFIGKDFLLLSE